VLLKLEHNHPVQSRVEFPKKKEETKIKKNEEWNEIWVQIEKIQHLQERKKKKKMKQWRKRKRKINFDVEIQ